MGSINSVKKSVNKIEVFKPKRKFLAPRAPDFFLRKGQEVSLKVSGIEMTIKNTREQNVYVRIK